MPQLVPSLLKLPETPKIQLPPRSQSAQGGQDDGQSFADTLDEVKGRAAKKSNDDDKPPAKVEQRKQARPSKPAEKGDATGKSDTKTVRAKDSQGAQDGEAQSDANPDQSGQNDPKPQKQAGDDKSSPEPDESLVLQPAAVVQLQARKDVGPAKSVQQSKEGTRPSSGAGKRPVVQPVLPKQPDEAKPKDNNADVTPDQSADADTPQAADNAKASTPGKANVPPVPTDGSTTIRKAPLLGTKDGQRTQGDSNEGRSADAQAAVAAAQAMADVFDAPDDAQPATDAGSDSKPVAKLSLDDVTGRSMPQADASAPKGAGSMTRSATPQPDAPPAPPEAQFAEANHAKIVGGIQGQLLPNGGSMHIRLDPPELGALNVRVEMRDGVMTAAFETTNDQATKLLSHSLGDLKTALEAQGVSVEKLHVRQSSQQQSSSGDDRKGNRQQDSAAQREQQRRDLMRRMWRRLMKGQDPLDLVA
jgi:flagellar hook-length control protein FliK